jgi:LytS/YehU family sensor histidine kinase
MIFNIINPINPVLITNDNDSKGIGLINVQKRLDLMYPGKYMLHIEDYNETFSVNLTLELED